MSLLYDKERDWDEMCEGREHDSAIGNRWVYSSLRNQYRSNFVGGAVRVYKKGGSILRVLVHCFIFILDYASLYVLSIGLGKASMFWWIGKPYITVNWHSRNNLPFISTAYDSLYYLFLYPLLSWDA